MDALPQDFLALAGVVFLFGMKHGFDADHLATIDGLTRCNAAAGQRWARYCGALFSLGHGAVVIGVALAASFLAKQWQTPEWLQSFGAWLSIAFLFALGFLNVQAVWRAAPDQVVQPVGCKGRLLGRLAGAATPGCVAFVGALFALSFDTLTQAALFALAAAQFGGWQDALLLGLLFMLGMLVTDGINGFWISRLLRRADQTALLASRVMSLAVGGVSLLVGMLGVLRLSSLPVADWSAGKELYFGAGILAVIAASFLLSVRLTRGGARAAAALAE
ncbi:MAG: nickel transporter [Rhodocyclales bacterium]|nr:nickel transporter [Rhodocyclales bacterium]